MQPDVLQCGGLLGQRHMVEGDLQLLLQPHFFGYARLASPPLLPGGAVGPIRDRRQRLQGGNDALRALYDEARTALTDRIFSEDAQGELVPDTPATRLLVRGWSAFVEELVLTWAADPGDVTREQLLTAVTDSLPALVALPTR